MRGGGPQRLSKKAVTEHISQTISVLNLEKEKEKVKVICVFDHAPGNHGSGQGMEVIYSGDTIADDKIVEMVEAFGPDDVQQTCVVTCDRGLALRLLSLNAHVMQNSTFNALNLGAH